MHLIFAQQKTIHVFKDATVVQGLIYKGIGASIVGLKNVATG